MDNLNYWLITTEYPPHKGGGIGTYCYETACMLRDNGHEVTVFVYDLSLTTDKISIENGIRVVRFVPEKTGATHFLGFTAALSYEYAQIVKLYSEKEGIPAIIESQEYLGIAYYLQQFKLLGYNYFKDISIIITCHAPSFICLEYNHVPVYQFPDYWTGQMEKSSIRCADILISPSRYFVNQAKERMEWSGLQELYLANPLKTHTKNSALAFTPNYIVFFGKLAPLKGTFELLRYFKEMWDGGFSHPLHMIGGTQQIFHPERLTMGDWVRKNYPSYIEKGLLLLHGEYTPEEAREKLQQAHVVVVSSLFDNLPYTVLEAMSRGKVVLASVQGGQSEVIIHGENGFLFDHSINEDFKNKLLSVLNLSDTQLHSIGENARKIIEKHYSYEVVYPLKKKIIRESLENRAERKQFPFQHQPDKISGPDATNESVKGLLSVVIPFYNMGKYIEECVQSVCNSAYPEKEIIIIDDGCTDKESLSKLGIIKEKYPVIIHHKRNEGLPEARNTGAVLSRGEFLAFLDADDTVHKNYYDKAIHVLKNYDNVHFAGCWTKYFGDSTDTWPTFNPEPPYLLIHNMVNSSSLVYKKSAFLKAGINDRAFVYGMEDWDSVINMVENNLNGIVLPETLFNYRVRKGSMARNFTRVKRLYLHYLVSKKHNKLYEKYATDIVNLLQANGSSLNFDNPTLDLPGSFYLPLIPGRWQEKLKRKVKRNRILRNFAYSIYKKVKK